MIYLLWGYSLWFLLENLLIERIISFLKFFLLYWYGFIPCFWLWSFVLVWCLWISPLIPPTTICEFNVPVQVDEHMLFICLDATLVRKRGNELPVFCPTATLFLEAELMDASSFVHLLIFDRWESWQCYNNN